jgi:hypothetical protein
MALRSKCAWRDCNTNEDALGLLKAGATLGKLLKYEANWTQNISKLDQTMKIFQNISIHKQIKAFEETCGRMGPEPTGRRSDSESDGDILVDEERGVSRKLHNEELHYLYSSPNIIRMTKSRRMRCVGHVARMGRR